ncbi:MAG: fatty-acid oxidation protein subunit alpha [Okeania sp. SIO3I5]|uniref:XisH family protein n=1 Tax=Okeania sp. SIO3I5 TaxID=2607805 RepID=UPI0013B5F177|nr:XisH family protein [Okeania sp. SIO3I5]NEQ35853.1 fatty-acid oxidation protein subunit alpha [Okeania sp. SIO3I5]
MSAKDIFHDAVRSALEKDGWLVTHDPLFMRVGDVNFQIDLGAEKIIAAEKDNRKIAVEVKYFVGKSEVKEFHLTLGQILNYRSALRKIHPNRILYLAITFEVYDSFFRREFVQDVVAEHQLKLLIFEPNKEEIITWKN